MVEFKRDMNSEMLNWFINHNGSMNIVNVLLLEGNLELANHLVYLVMTLPQRREYTLFTAEQSVVIYEEVYSGDKCLRKAIDAWKKLMKEMSDKNSVAYEKALDNLEGAYGKYNNIIQSKKDAHAKILLFLQAQMQHYHFLRIMSLLLLLWLPMLQDIWQEKRTPKNIVKRKMRCCVRLY